MGECVCPSAHPSTGHTMTTIQDTTSCLLTPLLDGLSVSGFIFSSNWTPSQANWYLLLCLCFQWLARDFLGFFYAPFLSLNIIVLYNIVSLFQWVRRSPSPSVAVVPLVRRFNWPTVGWSICLSVSSSRQPHFSSFFHTEIMRAEIL